MWSRFLFIFLTFYSFKCLRAGKFVEKRQIETETLGTNFDDENISKVLEKNIWLSAIHLDRVRISWTPLEHSVVFYVEAKTRGYVGVGFSLDGKMAAADLVVMWVDDITGKPYLIDCHGGGGHAAPMKDQHQNYELLTGFQNDTHTVVRFSRDWDTCDSQDDLVLTNDTIRLLWAVYDEDPMDEDRGALLWHGRGSRGVQSVHLITPPLPQPQDEAMKSWEIRQENVEVPENTDTLYWCKIFKAPSITTKHQIIGFEPILEKAKAGGVHHMVLYECTTQPSLLERYIKHHGHVCYSSKIPPEWDSCVTPVVSWAIGSTGEFLPSHVGLPLQGNKATFMMLEVHYDNPTLRKAVHTAGLKIHYTNQLRPNDGGVFISGVAVSPLQIIPPRQTEYKTAGYCDNECTNAVFPSTGVQVTSVVLHSHLAGRKIKLRHIRHGHELTPIAQDEQYDFNYQQARRVPDEVIIYPGDQLITECTYQTLNRPQPTMVS
uniref:MOXD1 homolog 1 n=1 Tax=Cacopsylla melanoneura TaxID=428564 RepID=A0A8D8VXJ3_9HEMI